MTSALDTPLKPRALRRGSKIAVFSPASPGERLDLQAGIAELTRLGFDVQKPFEFDTDGYFAASLEERSEEFLAYLQDPFVEGMISTRGGYGSNYLLDSASLRKLPAPKCIVGFSDLTTLQVFLWQRAGWVTFHGPMVATSFSHGANNVKGYEETSFWNAVTHSSSGYAIDLDGESLAAGQADGVLLGGCLTLLQATLGAPWEPDFSGAILVLEDRGMKPYQVDRALMHLKQAGKLDNLRGIVLGEFSNGDPPVEGSPTIREVCERILAPLNIPILWRAAVGHTTRPILTIPLGVRAHLDATSQGRLDILEPTVTEQ